MMEKFRFIRKKWRLFVGPVVSIILVIPLFFLVIVPRVRQIIELREKINKESERLEKLTVKLTSLEGIDDVSLQEKRDSSLKAISSKKDIMTMISFLNNLAQESRVFIDSLKVAPGEISTASASSLKNSSEILSFSIKTIGEWEKNLDFMTKLEKSLPLMNLKSFKISQSQAQFIAETYFADLPKSLGKIETPLQKLNEKEEELLKLIADYRSYEGMEMSLFSSVSATPRSNPFSD